VGEKQVFEEEENLLFFPAMLVVAVQQ